MWLSLNPFRAYQGARRVYDDYLRPFLAAHEADIDRGLLELRARAKDATASHLQPPGGRGARAGVSVRDLPSRFVAVAGDPKPGTVGAGTVTCDPAAAARLVYVMIQKTICIAIA